MARDYSARLNPNVADSVLISGKQYQNMSPWEQKKYTYHGDMADSAGNTVPFWRILPEYVEETNIEPQKTQPVQQAQPVATQPVQQVKPPTSFLDTALLERLEEKIMGDQLTRNTNALRERQNMAGVFHSTPASQNEQRLADTARDQFQAAQMSLMADESSREMTRLQQMQNMLQQSVSNANQQYKSQYNNYLNQNAQYNQQQKAYGKLASNNPWGNI